MRFLSNIFLFLFIVYYIVKPHGIIINSKFTINSNLIFEYSLEMLLNTEAIVTQGCVIM